LKSEGGREREIVIKYSHVNSLFKTPSLPLSSERIRNVRL